MKKLKKLDLQSIQETIFVKDENSFCVNCELPLKTDRTQAKLSKYQYFDGKTLSEMESTIANAMFNEYGSFDILFPNDCLGIDARNNTFCNCFMKDERVNFWNEYLQELENAKYSVNNHYFRVVFNDTFEKMLLVRRENLRKQLLSIKNSSEKDVSILYHKKIDGNYHKLLAQMRAKFRKDKEKRMNEIRIELKRIDRIITTSQTVLMP